MHTRLLRQVGLAMPTMLCAATLLAADFQKLPLVNPPSNITISEDGRLLAVAHEMEDSFSVVDVKTGKLVRQVKTARPKCILWRGDKVLAANGGKGTISVFTPSKDWELTDEVEVGNPDPFDLAAPQGQYFDGNLLAICKTGRDSRVVQAINIKKDAHREIMKAIYMSTATVSYDGRYWYHQGVLGHSPSGTIGGVQDFQALTKGKKVEVTGRAWDPMPLLGQVQKGPYWFGSSKICKGLPPKPMGEKLGTILVADRKANCCYGIDRTTIKCIGLDAAMTAAGTQAAAFPKEYERMSAKPPWISPYDLGTIDRLHIAVTHGKKLYIYLYSRRQKMIFYCKADAFTLSEAVTASAPASSGGGPAAAETGELPTKVQVGKRINCKIGKVKGQYELVRGPDGVKVSKDGKLTWTPTKDDVGTQQIKVRMKVGQDYSFVRLNTEVVDLSDLAGGRTRPGKVRTPGGATQPARPAALVDLENAGIHELLDAQFSISNGLGGESFLLVDGSRFRVLDKSGLTVVRTHEFGSRYRKIFERPDYYVALGAKSVDLLSKKTLAVGRSIPIDYSQVGSLAIHPSKKISYVTVKNPADKDVLKSRPVLEVNEATGAVRKLPGVAGDWVLVNPNGRTLYTGLREIFKDGVEYDPHWHRFHEKYGHIDMLLAYDITGATPREIGRNENPGANGRGIYVAADGKHVSHVAGGGAPGHGYSVPAFAADDVNRETSRYKVEAYPKDMTFHPTANLVACTNGNTVWVFNRHTSERVSDRLGSALSFKGIERISFAPGGTRLLVAHNHPKRGRVVEAVALKLTDTDRAEIAKGFPRFGPAGPASTAKLKAVRIWSDKTGQFKVKATLLSIKGGKVALQKEDGQTIVVPFKNFCDADQKFLRKWAGQ